MLACDRCLGREDATDERHELVKEFPRGRSRRHTMRYLEKCAPLLGRQTPVPAVRDLGHRLLKSRVGKIFPPQLGIVGHDSVHFARIRASSRGLRHVFHTTSC